MKFCKQAIMPSTISGSSLSRDHLLEVCPYSTKAGANIPRLPVPPLQQTFDRFLLSIRPLVTTDKYKHAVNVRSIRPIIKHFYELLFRRC